MKKEDAVFDALGKIHRKNWERAFAEPVGWQQSLMRQIRQSGLPALEQAFDGGVGLLRVAWGMLGASVAAALIFALVQVFWFPAQTDYQMMAMSSDSAYDYITNH